MDPDSVVESKPKCCGGGCSSSFVQHQQEQQEHRDRDRDRDRDQQEQEGGKDEPQLKEEHQIAEEPFHDHDCHLDDDNDDTQDDESLNHDHSNLGENSEEIHSTRDSHCCSGGKCSKKETVR